MQTTHSTPTTFASPAMRLKQRQRHTPMTARQERLFLILCFLFGGLLQALALVTLP
jgi:hypothetical protein